MSLRRAFLLVMLLGCGDPDSASGGGGGSSGSATGGSATGGSATGGSGGVAGSETGGTATGGSGAEGGTSGSGGSWDSACGDVTHNGRCDGDVYRFCDYFTRSVREMDCGARGMTCQALEAIPNEEDTNGCVALGTCDATDAGCDGNVISSCRADGLHVVDCRKNKGPSSTCLGDRCARTELCGLPGVTCDGSMAVVCDEEGHVYLQNCKQRDPTGVCVEDTPGNAYCDPSLTGDG